MKSRLPRFVPAIVVGGQVGRIYPSPPGRFVGGCVGFVPLTDSERRYIGGCVGHIPTLPGQRFVGGCVGFTYSYSTANEHAELRIARVDDAPQEVAA